MRSIVGVLVSAVLVAGCAGATGSAAPAASAPAPAANPSASGAIGGTVQFKSDGSPATTTVDAVADSAGLTGTAVTTFGKGTHTVKLGCAARNGDTWALGGMIDQTTLPGESAGNWSAVIVKDGSPQKIAIWLSDDPSKAADCNAWLSAIDFSTIGLENFTPVDSGTLVPPPVSAP